jgi:hypothetical protein
VKTTLPALELSRARYQKKLNPTTIVDYKPVDIQKYDKVSLLRTLWHHSHFEDA